MKKGLLCLIVAMLTVLPLILTSCGDDRTPEEIANANFQEVDTALTLSFWLPADDSVKSVEADDDKNGNGLKDTFDERLDDVEAEFNDYLISNNYCTKIDFVVVSEDEYYSRLTEKFGEIKELEATNGKAYLTANKYVNHAVKNEVTGIYEMAYPDVLDNQLDIFFVGGYNNYIGYINSGDTYSINEFFTDGQTYNGLFKTIRNLFFDATKVGNQYYGIPNNHVFSEAGQYVLVNKELYDANSENIWDDTYTLYSLQSYIEQIGNAGLNGVVPYVGDLENIPGIVYLDKENLIAAAAKDAVTVDGKITLTPAYLPDMPAFKTYLAFYKTLSEGSYVKDSLNEGEVAAVQIYNGNLLDLENQDDYYIIETIPPYAGADSVYSSMFAISTHSANYERSMQIIYLLQTNTQLRTLLQYGVEEVDYDYGTVDGETVINVNDSGYKMNMMYTGNCYRTYPESGVPMSYWEEIKELNLETQLNPYMNFELKYNNSGFSEEDMASFNEYSSALAEANRSIMEAFNSMTYDAYVEWTKESSAILINRNLINANKAYESAQTAYNEAKAIYDSAETEDAKQAAAATMEEQSAIMAEQQIEVEKWTAVKTVTVAKNDNINTINDFLTLCTKMYNSTY